MATDDRASQVENQEEVSQDDKSHKEGDKKKTPRRKGLEDTLSGINKKIDESSKASTIGFLTPFYAAHYDKPEIPDEAIEVDEEDNFYISPQVEKPWVCKYYYSPERKARLARHSAYAIAIMAISMASALTQVPGGISALVLGVVLLINFQFRYRDIALWKWPMPEIPVLSNLDLKSQYDEMKMKIEEEQREKEEYQEMVEQGSSVEFIEPVDDYRDGNPSPATILTNWMNISAHMDKQEFIDASDGKLNNFTMDLLLGDNEGAWRDETILDTVSYITETNAQDWLDAYELWEKSDEK